MKARIAVALVILFAAIQVLAADDVKEKKVQRIVVGPRFNVVSPGSTVRGYLGVSLLNLTPELREHFGKKESGIMVSRVTADGPAAKAGLQVGDVITAIDGVAVDSAGDVGKLVGSRKEGEQVRIDVVRDRAARRLTARVEEHSWPAIYMPENFEGFNVSNWKSDPENAAALESLQTFFKSPEWKANLEEFRDCARNDEKLRRLEQRMQELEKRLKEK